jgi:hypothetical protein
MEPATTGTRVLDNYIGGAWTPSSGSERLDVLNPAKPPARRCPPGAPSR